MLTSRLTRKAQTTIPQPLEAGAGAASSPARIRLRVAALQRVRRALHLEPGDRVEYVVRGAEVLLRKVREEGESEDPFSTFGEWGSEADRAAYGDP